LGSLYFEKNVFWSAKGTNLLLQKHEMKRIKCSSSIVVLCMSTSMSCKLAFESKKGGHKPFPQHVVSHARKIVHPFRGLVVAPMRLEISLYCLPYLFLVCHGIWN